MSDFAEKLEQRRPSTGGRAAATRKQLLDRRGARQVDAATIEIDSMGRRELWLRVGSRGDNFELEVRQ